MSLRTLTQSDSVTEGLRRLKTDSNFRLSKHRQSASGSECHSDEALAESLLGDEDVYLTKTDWKEDD